MLATGNSTQNEKREPKITGVIDSTAGQLNVGTAAEPVLSEVEGVVRGAKLRFRSRHPRPKRIMAAVLP